MGCCGCCTGLGAVVADLEGLLVRPNMPDLPELLEPLELDPPDDPTNVNQ